MDATASPQQMSAEPASGPDSRRGFWALFVTQFQAAFSDNAFKTLALFLILGLGLDVKRRDLFVELGNVCFALPFILFSMGGGYLADRYSKRSVTIATKVADLAAITLGVA